ncbi:N-formylglutamate amidohydrolase [Microvirga makkahensis]|uniref:N-formylglutamate amidohydrolase n=1 Tax=Microvirga makkahensis TaxID=1128670 RepID=A0A7X3SMT1_9HYPH|nr:N-formylglutamate amidohydrolase [Microvirga makkahensis]MXQ10626.1 N-formylglutamate amidohydrolase [Microvirga makkahensis]
MLQSNEILTALLSPRDPLPVEVVNGEGRSAIVLSCEHAGRAIPEKLRDLGVPPADMERHIALDVGAEEVSRLLSALLDAPLVLQRYSRLVVDCNRPFDAWDCFPVVSDGTRIPGNEGLGERDRLQRFEEIHQPFHRVLAGVLDRRSGTPTFLVSVHSFTPQLLGGATRPWHMGVLFNRDRRLADRFLAEFRARNPNIPAAPNEPYSVDDFSDYTIPVHGERRGLPHLLLEIRNDLIMGRDGQSRWADLVVEALAAAITEEM